MDHQEPRLSSVADRCLIPFGREPSVHESLDLPKLTEMVVADCGSTNAHRLELKSVPSFFLWPGTSGIQDSEVVLACGE